MVTYTINPKAMWSDGTPITWENIASQIRSTNGADNRQAVVTFAKPYARWRGMFAGNSRLLPKSMTATAEAFDIAQFGWVGDAFPLSALTQIYASGGESNFGKIGSPKIDAAIEQALEALDPGKARALADEVDKLIWAEGFSLPLTQSPGVVAVRNSLANFGATGLADLDYTAIGFMRS